jgi:hypothetical protein
VAALAAGMTAFYMFRALFMTFFGESRVDHHVAHHIHESPKIMTVPLMVLAVLSVVGDSKITPELSRLAEKKSGEGRKVDIRTVTSKEDFTGSQIVLIATKELPELAEILKLNLSAEQRPTPAELERYTLRFDVTYPDRDDNGLPGWEVTAYNTLGTAFPYENARRDAKEGQRQTVSITLDQLSSWSDTSRRK